jgi:hypothetical protein
MWWGSLNMVLRARSEAVGTAAPFRYDLVPDPPASDCVDFMFFLFFFLTIRSA